MLGIARVHSPQEIVLLVPDDIVSSAKLKALQASAYKLRKKRVLKMAPIRHQGGLRFCSFPGHFVGIKPVEEVDQAFAHR